MKKEPFLLKDSLLKIEAWASINDQVIAGITTRQGGFSHGAFSSLNLGLHVNDCLEDVIRNRKKLATVLGAPLSKWVCSEQVHAAKIKKVTSADGGKGSSDMDSAIKGVDGLYTKEKNLFLVAAYADCVPLYFLSRSSEVIGVAHAGWRGTVRNISGEMIQKWTNDEKINVNDIFVCIGPSIGRCCYIVDDHVINQLAIVLDDEMMNNVYNEVSTGQYNLDLKQANYQLLIKAGILPNQIEVSSYCTSCQDDLFFSHRRDQGKTGRMLSFIGIKDNDGGSSIVY